MPRSRAADCRTWKFDWLSAGENLFPFATVFLRYSVNFRFIFVDTTADSLDVKYLKISTAQKIQLCATISIASAEWPLDNYHMVNERSTTSPLVKLFECHHSTLSSLPNRLKTKNGELNASKPQSTQRWESGWKWLWIRQSLQLSEGNGVSGQLECTSSLSWFITTKARWLPASSNKHNYGLIIVSTEWIMAHVNLDRHRASKSKSNN